jgi:hypothetical protein
MSSLYSAEHSSTPITLEEVKAQFVHWRASRTKVGKIPSALWNAAKQLTKQYECRQIITELKLNSRRQQMLYAHLGKKPSESDFAPAGDFVKVSLPLTSPSSDHSVSTLEVLRADGTTLKAQGLTPKDLCVLIERFFE